MAGGSVGVFYPPLPLASIIKQMMIVVIPSLPSAHQLNKAFQAEESPGVIYCISMQWFREWEAFVKGKDNGKDWQGGELAVEKEGWGENRVATKCLGSDSEGEGVSLIQ